MISLARLKLVSFSDVTLLLEAIVWLVVASLITLLPFRWLQPWLGRPVTTHDKANQFSQLTLLTMISRSVARANTIVPWRCQSLALAMTAKWMLNRRAIRSTLFFGIGKQSGGGLIAQTWLCVGGVTVIGDGQPSSFNTVARFS